jgi:murein DD-endopeptidase MepM/ murein hydrolase activator NlpD
MVRWVVALAAAALVVPALAHAYSWPLQPFYRMHPIRGGFDDPRLHLDMDGKPVGAFHFGIDISAPDGTPVYAVEPGRVVTGKDWVSVHRRNGRAFGYWHVRPAVRTGSHVRLHQLIGHILPGWGHVHFAEAVGGHYRNPLRPRALWPYRDTTAPVVDAIYVDSLEGNVLISAGPVLSGTIAIGADAYDLPTIAPPAPWSVARLTPAFLRWRLIRPGGEFEPWHVALDFTRLLLPSQYWSTYMPGSYQNKPNRPGDYKFWLTRSFDTAGLPSGAYWLQVDALDFAGNVGSDEIPLTIENPAQSG